DYNLDGQVDGSDYTVVDSFLGTPTPGLSAGWTLGDGDFDGLVTPADYLPIDSNFGSGVGNPLADFTIHSLALMPLDVERSWNAPASENPDVPGSHANSLMEAIWEDQSEYMDDPLVEETWMSDELAAGAVWLQSAGRAPEKSRTQRQAALADFFGKEWE
ncbi:MAG: hypothetical protein SFX18_17460, partial [Pirellulales bacterium]|nr:hypothetical protein [Pirellulales bacterium]